MTALSYQHLFQLDIFHTYFQNNICRCLEFNADAATLKLMKRFHFLLRRQVNGLGMYSNSGQTPEQLFSYIEKSTGQNSFCFEIRTNNPDFNLFTALPPGWVGQIIYTSQDCSTANDRIRLHQELSGNAGTACMGSVTLRFEDILKYSEQTAYAWFDINFEGRATQWQYYVINRSLVPLIAPAIEGKDNINFEGPENVITVTGQAALLFSSGSQLIPLTEVPIYKFDLVDQPASAAAGKKTIKPKMIIKGLPNPDPQWIGKGTGKAIDQLSSPMYIYL